MITWIIVAAFLTVSVCSIVYTSHRYLKHKGTIWLPLGVYFALMGLWAGTNWLLRALGGDA